MLIKYDRSDIYFVLFFVLIVCGNIFYSLISNEYKKALEYGIIDMNYQIKTLKAKNIRLKIEIDKHQRKLESRKGNSGKASYYDYVLKSGWSSKGHLVCASRDYKRGTTLIVKNLENGLKTSCLVTDYGPNAKIHPDRIIDLSSRAFGDIAQLKQGIINVYVYEQ